METLFRGRFDVRVDDKGRFRMPTALRNSHSPKDTKNNQLLVTNNLVQGQRCLDIYTQSAWLRLENRIARLPNLKAEVQAFQRFYLSGAQLMEYDKNGRVLMPPSLRKYARASLSLRIDSKPNSGPIRAPLYKASFKTPIVNLKIQ